MPQIIRRLGMLALAVGITLMVLRGVAVASSGDERGAGDAVRFGPVVVQRPSYDKDAEESFRRHDKDNTGKLTKDKAPRWLREDWELWDKDGKGFLDLSEYEKAYKERNQFAGRASK